jgi:hypothetical protein
MVDVSEMDTYRCLWKIELLPGKGVVRVFTFISMIISAFAFVSYSFANPHWTKLFFRFNRNAAPNALPLLFILLVLVFIAAHELIHAFFMKIFGAAEVKVKFALTCAYASCEGEFGKAQYLILLLSPLAVISGVSALLFAITSNEARWLWYVVLVLNTTGSIGDIYISQKVIRTEKGAFIRESGFTTSAVAVSGDG